MTAVGGERHSSAAAARPDRAKTVRRVVLRVDSKLRAARGSVGN